MKKKSYEFDREKKLHKVNKGTDKVAKYKKSIYNMLSEDDSDYVEGEVEDNYFMEDDEYYFKQR
jgi:hypothetical protein